MFCRNCGTQWPEETVFCGKCGTALKVAEPAPQPVEEASAPVVEPVPQPIPEPIPGSNPVISRSIRARSLISIIRWFLSTANGTV